MPVGPQMYPEDQLTEERPEDLIAELVRGAFLEELDDELPHSLAVTVDSIEPPEDGQKAQVHVSIYVERDSQKPIIIGHRAEHLVRVKKKLRTAVNRTLGQKATLDLHEVDYCVIASPSGPYFAGGVKPVSIWVEDKWFRTGPGGTGFAKCGGNYAASLLGEQRGKAEGCEQVCFVDAASKTFLEELGGMNMFAVHKDGHLETPSLTGTILPGVTRNSLIQLANDQGRDVVETMIRLQDLLEDIRSGEVTEVFACGTAAIITPIGRFKSEEFDVQVSDGGSGQVTMDLRNELLGIQLGEKEDPHNWMWKVC